MCGLVRSLTPTATAPLPIGIMSPPSRQARPKSSSSKLPSSPIGGYRYLEVGCGEHRMVVVDDALVDRLQPPGVEEQRVE